MIRNLHIRIADLVFAAPLSIAFLGMFVFFALHGEGFFSIENLQNVALQSAVLCIVSVAVGFVMIAGYIDLSVGSIMGFSGVAAGYLMSQAHWSPVWASLVGVALGAAAGLVSGILVAYLRFSALIVTLGMLTIMRGSTFVITPETFYDFGPGFGMLGSGMFLSLPIPVWIAAAVCIIGGIFLNFTAGGRHVYAVGVNQEAAYFSGINIRRIPLLLFMASGAAAARPTAGKKMRKVVPRPSLLSTVIWAPLCLTIPNTADRPSPFAIHLVVDAGSKARSTAASSMPIPSSLTLSSV